MSGEPTNPSDGIEPIPATEVAANVVVEVKETITSAVNRVSDAIETGKRPGMPLV